jgi:hypothetical protein
MNPLSLLSDYSFENNSFARFLGSGTARHGIFEHIFGLKSWSYIAFFDQLT